MSTMHYFVVSCIGHLENISSLNYTDLPNVDIFIPKYQKIPLIKYYCWFFVKRAFKFGKLSVENVGCKFSKVQSFTWKLNILAINTASCFLEVIGSLFFILKKMAANTQVSVTVVCHQSFFQVNDVSFKKKNKKWAWLFFQTSAQDPFPRTASLQNRRNALWVLPTWSHYMKKMPSKIEI